MHQNQWVVRSSGRILGPFTTDEVIRRLESRNISVIDEVSAPFSRWSYIRDREQFAAAVERLQKTSYDGREDTKTISSQTQTMTMTEMTQKIDDLPSIRDVRPSAVKDIQPTKIRKTGPPVTSNQSSLGLYILSGLLVVAFAGYFFLQKKGGGVPPVAGAHQLGHLALAIGHYDEAKIHFSDAYKESPDDPETVLNYASLLISGGETVQGKRVLEKVFGYKIGAETQKKADLLMGVASIVDQELEKAKAYFERHADLTSPQGPFLPASFNLGIAFSMQDDFAKADEIFKGSVDKIDNVVLGSLPFSESSDGFFYRAYNLALQFQRLKKPRNLINARTAAAESLRRSPRYRLESLLLLSWINAKLRNIPLANQYIAKFLDVDPMLSSAHVRSLFVFNDYVSWEKLHWFCSDLAATVPQSARLSAMLAVCEFKRGNTYQVRAAIKDAASQSAKDGLVKAVEAFLLIEAGDLGRAETVLQIAAGGDQIFSLPFILKGKTCWQMEDQACAYKNWMVAYNRNPQDVEAIAGLARYFLSRPGERVSGESRTGAELAKDYLARGLRVSPTYRPFLEIRNELDKI